MDLTAAQETLQFHTDAAYVWDACSSRHRDAVQGIRCVGDHEATAPAVDRPQRRAGSLHGANNIDTWLENLGRSLCGAQQATLSTSVLEREAPGK